MPKERSHMFLYVSCACFSMYVCVSQNHKQDFVFAIKMQIIVSVICVFRQMKFTKGGNSKFQYLKKRLQLRLLLVYVNVLTSCNNSVINSSSNNNKQKSNSGSANTRTLPSSRSQSQTQTYTHRQV